MSILHNKSQYTYYIIAIICIIIVINCFFKLSSSQLMD